MSFVTNVPCAHVIGAEKQRIFITTSLRVARARDNGDKSRYCSDGQSWLNLQRVSYVGRIGRPRRMELTESCHSWSPFRPRQIYGEAARG